jgi:hypothetical protein
MNMHYDLAKAEIASRLQDAEHRRSAKRARTRQWSRLPQRWQLVRPL